MYRRANFLLVAIAIAHGSALLIRAQAEPTYGTISGQVTTSSGELPSNTVVYVSVLGVANPPRTLVVSNDGTFKIDRLEIGVYRVSASAPGFVPDSRQANSDNRGLYHTGDSANLSLRKGGVITGKVINRNNAPVVAANVRAFLVRDENGKTLKTLGSFKEGFTDDRGVYRIFGLAPGSYIVSAGGMARYFGGTGTSAYDQDVPTYAPSSTRDTAMEITVRSGEEATADIQYRGEPGHAISGTLVNVAQASTGVSFGGTVSLADVKGRTMLMSTSASPVNNYSFAFYGLPDGEYELVAQQFSQSRDTRASDPKRITLRSADITGVMLAVGPLPSIQGRVILDDTFTADCVKRRVTALQEMVISARRQKPAKSAVTKEASTIEVPITSIEMGVETVPDAKGEFALRNLRAGTYRFSVNLPSTAWYLRSVTLGANTRATDSRLISDGLTLNPQSISGLAVILSEGAARIRGSVTLSEGKHPTDRLIVYLVPTEKEAANNLLKYFETGSEADGSFDIRNVPPGDYSMVAMKADDERPSGILIRQDTALRANVVREAEKLKQTVTLKPCQRVDNFELPYQSSNKP